MRLEITGKAKHVESARMVKHSDGLYVLHVHLAHKNISSSSIIHGENAELEYDDLGIDIESSLTCTLVVIPESEEEKKILGVSCDPYCHPLEPWWTYGYARDKDHERWIFWREGPKDEVIANRE